MSPSDLSSLSRKFLGMLNVPRRRGANWECNAAMLPLPDGLEMHFSGHCPRNFLTSVAAVLGFSKDMRAYLGRWAVGMSSSEEYVRAARQVVFKIQVAVNKSVVEGRDEVYYEDEALDSLCKIAEIQLANPARIRKRHGVMSDHTGRMCLGGIYPTLEVRPDDWEDVGDEEGDPAQLALRTETQLAEAKALETKADQSKFFVTVSRRAGRRKVHLMGCFVKPSNCCQVRFLNQVSGDDFDSICRACKRKMTSDCSKDDNNVSSSTASSSSTEIAMDSRLDLARISSTRARWVQKVRVPFVLCRLVCNMGI